MGAAVSSLMAMDMVHQSKTMSTREESARHARTIHLVESMEGHSRAQGHSNKEIFLSNESNKGQLIFLLGRYLQADSQIVHNSTGDADTMIVTCALQFASQGQEVNTVADDTDILVLLMHHWKQDMADIFFQSEAKKSC